MIAFSSSNDLRSIHTGENAIGHTFDMAYPNFERDIAQPHVRFAKEQLFRTYSASKICRISYPLQPFTFETRGRSL
jgi:hypothetical protein